MKRTRKQKEPRAAQIRARLDAYAATLGSSEWQRRLKNLKTAIAQAEPTDAQENHAEWQERILWHLSAQQAKRKPERIAKAVRQHLETCAACRAFERDLRVMLESDAPIAKHTHHAALPFQPALGDAWFQVPSSQSARAKPRVRFLWNPAYLQKHFSGGSLLTVRVVPPTDAEAVLLDDALMLDGQTLHAQVFLVPSTQPERYHLRVHLTTTEALHAPIQVHLKLGAQTYTGLFVSNQMEFEDISPPDFTAVENMPSTDFTLTFEPLAPVKGEGRQSSRPM